MQDFLGVGLFTELAKHPEDLETLQGRLSLHPRSARDFLDALVSLKFLERRNGRYYNTPSTDFFLDKQKPPYIGGILEMATIGRIRFGPASPRRSERGFRRTKRETAAPTLSRPFTPNRRDLRSS